MTEETEYDAEEAKKNRLKTLAKQQRKFRLKRGIVFKEHQVCINDKLKSRISIAAQAARSDSNLTFEWQFGNEWEKLTAEEVHQLESEVSDYIEACFERHKQLVDEIDAGEDVDFSKGWP